MKSSRREQYRNIEENIIKNFRELRTFWIEKTKKRNK